MITEQTFHLARMPVPKLVKKWFLLFFCSSASNMGLFDRQLLVVLKGGKSWRFQQIAGAKNDMSLKTASKFQKRN
jgi:hypothetical protein